MVALLDARPPGLDILYRDGNSLTVELTWPAGQLDGRTFTSDLGSTALALSVLGDVMTIVASDEITAAKSAAEAWRLVETTGGGSEIVLQGVWTPSSSPQATTATALEVTDGEVAVDVTVVSAQASVVALDGRVDDLETGKVDRAGDTITGDLTIEGEILTGTLGAPATFGGIQREARVWPAGEMLSPTAVINFGDGFPRLNLPPGVRTDVYMIFEVEEWWLDSTIGVYFEWVNDHTASGNVRWDCEIKECDIATETLAAADVIASRTFTHDGSSEPAPNEATTSIVASVANGNPCTFDPGPFASFYVLRISRLGGDAADTLGGPVGLLAASMTRGQ